jgi:hypothetical protein
MTPDNPEQTIVTLDDVTRQFIAEAHAELERIQANLMAQQHAAIALFIRREKLPGNWRLTPDGASLELQKG